MPRFIQLTPADNIILAIDSFQQGDVIDKITAQERIMQGHKMANNAIKKGAEIIKYGQVICFAKELISPGMWVHEHNVYVEAFERTSAESYKTQTAPSRKTQIKPIFQGYKRANGKFGTRNYIAILSSVNCSATAVRFIAQKINSSGILDKYPNVDGVIPLVHGTGCGIGVKGEAYDVLKRTQWGYASNANVGGVLMVGLGCEAFQIPVWMKTYGITENATFNSLTIQNAGGTRKAVAAGVEAIEAMLDEVNATQRSDAPASELILGLQCGGSDGYSGITANPALGVAVDMLVEAGGTAILSETPEIYGAEHLLINRAASPEVGEKLASLITWWEKYTAMHNMEMNNNPSPGNKMGGLTTILEKSLGSVAKGGSTPLRDVYNYAETVTQKGFVFMDTPGYAPVSATGQIAGGANVLCFTTGRGSAFGCKPTPCIKLASNSHMFERMEEDMDINCGDILDGVSLQDKGTEIFQLILDIASGAETKSEALDYGDSEFVPWSLGATM